MSRSRPPRSGTTRKSFAHEPLATPTHPLTALEIRETVKNVVRGSRAGGGLRGLGVAAGFAVALLVTVMPAHATFPGANGLMARAAKDGIHVMAPDGSGDVRVTRRGPYPYVGWLAWGPLGRRIAFSSGGDSHQLFVLNLRTGNTRQLTFMPNHDMSPSWSPDGRWITFVRYRATDSALYSVRASGGPPKRIHGAPNIVDAVRAPSGSLIAYSAGGGDANAGEDLFTVGTSGHGARRIVDFPRGYRVASISWSPHARRLALEVYGNCESEPAVLDCGAIWTVRRDGSKLGPVTKAPGKHPNRVFWTPSWAPDGGSIAFCATTFRPPSYDSTLRLRAVDPDGGRPRTLGPLCGGDWQPLLPD